MIFRFYIAHSYGAFKKFNRLYKYFAYFNIAGIDH